MAASKAPIPAGRRSRSRARQRAYSYAGGTTNHVDHVGHLPPVDANTVPKVRVHGQAATVHQITATATLTVKHLLC